MATIDELLDALMRDCKKPTDLVGENGLLTQPYSKSRERVVSAEMSEYTRLSEEQS